MPKYTRVPSKNSREDFSDGRIPYNGEEFEGLNKVRIFIHDSQEELYFFEGEISRKGSGKAVSDGLLNLITYDEGPYFSLTHLRRSDIVAMQNKLYEEEQKKKKNSGGESRKKVSLDGIHLSLPISMIRTVYKYEE